MEMIDPRNAVKCATDYLDHMKDLIGENFNNLRLEELELSDNRLFWLVTLGYDILYKPSGIEKLMNPSNVSEEAFYWREYKIFNVDSQTGQVQSMKIRSIEK